MILLDLIILSHCIKGKKSIMNIFYYCWHYSNNGPNNNNISSGHFWSGETSVAYPEFSSRIRQLLINEKKSVQFCHFLREIVDFLLIKFNKLPVPQWIHLFVSRKSCGITNLIMMKLTGIFCQEVGSGSVQNRTGSETVGVRQSKYERD